MLRSKSLPFLPLTGFLGAFDCQRLVCDVLTCVSLCADPARDLLLLIHSSPV